MAEEYAGHQETLESMAIEYQASDQKWGRIVALIAVVLVLDVCVYALHLGHVDFAARLGTWTVVALACVFVAGRIPEWIRSWKFGPETDDHSGEPPAT